MSLPKKAKKRNGRKVAIVLGSLLVLILVGYRFLENYIESSLVESINSDPDRSYDLSFEKVKLNILNTQVRLDEIRIIPLAQDSASVRLQGTVKLAQLNGFGVLAFLFDRQVVIDQLEFIDPNFEFIYTDITQGSSGTSSFQDFFGDVISRGEIKNFALTGGSARLLVQEDTLREIGSFRNFDILAEGLATDSVRLNYAIPFEFENIRTSWQDFTFSLEKGKTFHIKSFAYDYLAKEISVSGLGLDLDGPWQQFAKAEKFQGDIIEFYIKSLQIKQLNPSTSFYGAVSFSSQKMEIDSLVLRDGRDKNKPRPEDVIKKNFAFLLKNLPVPLEVDTISIRNSTVIYEEIEQGSTMPGRLELSGIDADLTNVTSIDSLEQNPLTIQLKAKLNQSGNLSMDLVESYTDLTFSVVVKVLDMDMKDLNPILENLVGMRINSGRMSALILEMNSKARGSDNKFSIEYSDLDVELLQKDSKDRSRFFTSMAQMAYHKNVSKTDKNYREPTYYTERNMYRGPINLIWLSTKDGLMQTIPTGAVRLLLPQPDRKRKNRD